MDDHKIDFRWGIPELDSGFTTIPNYIIGHYAELGVTPVQFALVIHLSSFHFNSARGQSSPSIGTIAEGMGVSTRYVQKLTRSLEDNHYLEITVRPGKTNIYSLQGLALACLKLEKGDEPGFTPEPECTPPPNPSSPPPPNPSSPEEQESKNKNQQQQPAVAVSSRAIQEGREKLEALGIPKAMAAGLVSEYGPERVGEAVDYVKRSPGDIKNPAGWIITALEGEYILSKPGMESAAEAKMEAARVSCVFRRNQSMGECPTEEHGKSVYPWCRGCERACPDAV